MLNPLTYLGPLTNLPDVALEKTGKPLPFPGAGSTDTPQSGLVQTLFQDVFADAVPAIPVDTRAAQLLTRGDAEAATTPPTGDEADAVMAAPTTDNVGHDTGAAGSVTGKDMSFPALPTTVAAMFDPVPRVPVATAPFEAPAKAAAAMGLAPAADTPPPAPPATVLAAFAPATLTPGHQVTSATPAQTVTPAQAQTAPLPKSTETVAALAATTTEPASLPLQTPGGPLLDANGRLRTKPVAPQPQQAPNSVVAGRDSALVPATLPPTVLPTTTAEATSPMQTAPVAIPSLPQPTPPALATTTPTPQPTGSVVPSNPIRSQIPVTAASAAATSPDAAALPVRASDPRGVAPSVSRSSASPAGVVPVTEGLFAPTVDRSDPTLRKAPAMSLTPSPTLGETVQPTGPAIANRAMTDSKSTPEAPRVTATDVKLAPETPRAIPQSNPNTAAQSVLSSPLPQPTGTLRAPDALRNPAPQSGITPGLAPAQLDPDQIMTLPGAPQETAARPRTAPVPAMQMPPAPPSNTTAAAVPRSSTPLDSLGNGPMLTQAQAVAQPKAGLTVGQPTRDGTPIATPPGSVVTTAAPTAPTSPAPTPTAALASAPSATESRSDAPTPENRSVPPTAQTDVKPQTVTYTAASASTATPSEQGPEMKRGAFSAEPSVAEARAANDALLSPRAAATSPLQAPETPRQIAQQIAMAVQGGGDKTVEIQLNPVELGRVRITMTTTETGMTVNIVADRAETLDMMRRNADTLAQDFRDIGYGTTQFAFGQGSEQNGGGQNDGPADSDVAPMTSTVSTAEPADQTASTPALAPVTTTDRIDIRL